MNDTIRRTPVTCLLIAANLVLFLLCELQGGSGSYTVMQRMGAIVTPAPFAPDLYWRLLASMFLHFGFTHLFSNMVSLYVLGSFLEERISHIRVLLVFLFGGIGGNLISWWWYTRLGSPSVSAGASGAVSALLGAIAALTLLGKKEMRGISLPRLAFAVILVVLPRSDASIDLAAHAGGLLCGFLLMALLSLLLPESGSSPRY